MIVTGIRIIAFPLYCDKNNSSNLTEFCYIATFIHEKSIARILYMYFRVNIVYAVFTSVEIITLLYYIELKSVVDIFGNEFNEKYYLFARYILFKQFSIN